MLTLLKTLTLRDLLIAEAPSLILSLAIAEVFYKFHSFTLECLAFLATWSVVGWVVRRVLKAVGVTTTAVVAVQ